MADLRDTLQAKWEVGNRFANYGNALTQMQIRGFRSHANTTIEFHSPITAFCGLNGTGKSTILQLAAAGFRVPNGVTYYFSRFFIVSAVDPAPYRDDARVTYHYWQKSRVPSQTTITRRTGADRNRWAGYKRRAERYVCYMGCSAYMPRIERGDFLIYGAAGVAVTAQHAVSETTRAWTAQILGREYDGMESLDFQSGERAGKVLRMNRGGVSYAEPHMGFGEGRAAYLVETLETIPDKSLVLVEEPETSLHPSAQHKLGHYLMDVSIRRGHQILISTHSEYLLRGLPSKSRLCFHWEGGNLRQLQGLSASHAASIMTLGHDKALTVLVEDICAQSVVTEMLRRSDPVFLQSVRIVSAGDCEAIATTMTCLRDSGLQVAAVLDGDMPSKPKENIFALPGGLPPEKDMFAAAPVITHLEAQYALVWRDFAAANNFAQRNHHEWIPQLAVHLSLAVNVLISELARKYAETVDCAALTTLLKESITR